MNNPNANERNELIEQALQESVGGGSIRVGVDLCDFKCSLFGVDLCDFSCGVSVSI